MRNLVERRLAILVVLYEGTSRSRDGEAVRRALAARIDELKMLVALADCNCAIGPDAGVNMAAHDVTCPAWAYYQESVAPSVNYGTDLGVLDPTDH